MPRRIRFRATCTLLLCLCLTLPAIASATVTDLRDLFSAMDDGSPRSFVVQFSMSGRENDQPVSVTVNLSGGSIGTDIHSIRSQMQLRTTVTLPGSGSADALVDTIIANETLYFRIKKVHVQIDPDRYSALEFLRSARWPREWFSVPLKELDTAASRNYLPLELGENLQSTDSLTEEQSRAVAETVLAAIFDAQFAASDNGTLYTLRLKRDFLQAAVRAGLEALEQYRFPADHHFSKAKLDDMRRSIDQTELKRAQSKILQALRLHWQIETDRGNRLISSSLFATLRNLPDELQASLKIRSQAIETFTVNPPARSLPVEKFIEKIDQGF